MAQKYKSIVTPVGEAAYAWTTKPDDKFGDPQYKITLVLPEGPEADALKEKIEEAGKAFAAENGIKLKKVFNLPVKYFDDDEKDGFQGKVRFEFKSKYKPGCVDSARNALPSNVFVMSGDKVRVSALVSAYDGLGSGISVKLRNIQLIEKNRTVGNPGNEFDEVDGGFTVAPQDNEDF